MHASTTYIAIDVGEKRIGVARGDMAVKLATPVCTIDVDGEEMTKIQRIAATEQAELIVVGYPRNQSGEATRQTRYVEEFSRQLKETGVALVYQDESLTSVLAEERLKATRKRYDKGDIDSMAAAIILQDFIDQQDRGGI